MTVGSGLLVSRPRQQRTCGRPRQKTTSQGHVEDRPRLQGHVEDHVRPRLQGHVADHVSKDMWQTMSADHVNKYTWHNQMMTSVKRKLAHAMSTSDVNKLRHSGRFTSGVFTTNKCQKSRSPEGQRSEVALSRRSKIHRELGQPLDPGEEHVPHEEIHVSKTTSARTHGTIR
jgi:hypothetical protein